MRSIKRLFHHILAFGFLILIYIALNIPNLDTKDDQYYQEIANLSFCFQWTSIDEKQHRAFGCSSLKHIVSSIWTYEGTGLMKYIQWIVTRKIGNIRILQLNQNCEIIRDNYFLSDRKTERYVQVYFMSLEMNLTNDSKCSKDLIHTMRFGRDKIKQIYFRRKSIRSTVVYQYLDKNNGNFDRNNSLNGIIEKATLIDQYLLSYFQNSSFKIIDSEDMIQTNLLNIENILTHFIYLLGFNITKEKLESIVRYDSHHFNVDGTWWDQSETAENILLIFNGSNQNIVSKYNPFHYLFENESFSQYISDNRQCFSNGIFYQMQTETLPNRFSTDKHQRCSNKQFDCAFSDLYSFTDREQLYEPDLTNNYFNQNPIKCGFATESILDRIRNRYEVNATCQIVIFTCITNCYDPLPVVQQQIPPKSCFIALLDSKTWKVFNKHYPNGIDSTSTNVQWDFIDLGESESLFRVTAKLTETLKMLGHRMFPLAKWIIWLDGKASINNINDLLLQTKTPVVSLRHSDPNRTSESEIQYTIKRIIIREIRNFIHYKNSLEEIKLQQDEYKRDGFYSRSAALALSLFDIAIFIYRNNHPCTLRYLCGWHNEVNYFSYRGQLSVYYAAERLNLTNHLSFLPNRFYHTLGHRSMC